MQLPAQVNNRLTHFKKQMVQLAAGKIFSVVFLCYVFGISRNTFYKYRHLAAAGQLDYVGCAPHHHGLAKTQAVIDAVLAAREQFPDQGKKRLARYLREHGTPMSANTVQRILRAYGKALPARKHQRRAYRRFEAIAPNVIWSIDICYLYTHKRNGFDLYLITILDDHSRRVVVSRLLPEQTVVDVVHVLEAAVLAYGVPRVLVCDNGPQFTCSEFRRVCQEIGLAVDYAPKHYPQYKGKIERFFRTVREEMPWATSPELAVAGHEVWMNYYNTQRVHSSVLDEEGEEQVPEFRFTWKRDAARPLPAGLDLTAVFQVQRPQPSAWTRQVDGHGNIRYQKQRYHFPRLNKGDLVRVQEDKEQVQFFYQDHRLQTVAKPPRRQAAATRKVKVAGVVLFRKQRFQLGLAKGTQVIILQEGQDYVFYADGQLVWRFRGQESVQQSI
jgi:transposase InsO family protein